MNYHDQKVLINNDTWTVRFMDQDAKKMNETEELVNLGLAEVQKLRISIRKGMKKSVTRSTIVHELVHAFIYSYGYKIEDEESCCDFIASNADQILVKADVIMEALVRCR